MYRVPPTASNPASEPVISTKTILLVDDDNELRGALAEQFSLHDGFEALEAANASEALKMVETTRLDLVLLDWTCRTWTGAKPAS